MTPKVEIAYQSLVASFKVSPDFRVNFLTVIEENTKDYGDITPEDIITWCHNSYFSSRERTYWLEMVDSYGAVPVMKACKILYGQLIFEESCKQANITFVDVENDYKGGEEDEDI